MENLLNENALASVSAEELMKIGIQESDAVFLKLDEATWGALDELSRSLQTCESTALCWQCHGCRVRHAIYAHQMYSIQQLRSNIDNVEMLPLGTRMHIRHWQQQPQNHCGELEAAAPNGAEAVHDLLQLDFFVSSAGISFCVSCNNEILKESLRCLGCPAHCHHACWRMARHTQWQELVFVCLLCRAQKPDLNSRLGWPCPSRVRCLHLRSGAWIAVLILVKRNV